MTQIIENKILKKKQTPEERAVYLENRKIREKNTELRTESSATKTPRFRILVHVAHRSIAIARADTKEQRSTEALC